MLDNLYKKMQREDNCHDGIGYVNGFRPFNKATSNNYGVDFIDIVTIPPNSTIGNHRHGDNEETYIILKGNGRMRFEDQDIDVKEGDILPNKPFGEHGLVNNSKEDILLLVFEISKKN